MMSKIAKDINWNDYRNIKETRMSKYLEQRSTSKVHIASYIWVHDV